MFLPEYTITNKILKNIAAVEYAKALAENTPILPTLEETIQKEALYDLTKTICLEMEKQFSENQIKMAVDGLLPAVPPDLAAIVKTVTYTTRAEEDYSNSALKKLYQTLLGIEEVSKVSYRSQRIAKYLEPEELLAGLVELMDWCQSVDALETHHIIFAGVLRARLEIIAAFETISPVVSNLFTRMALKWRGYSINGFLKYEERFMADKQWYQKATYSIFKDEGDYTYWLEYFSEALAYDAMDIKEKVMLGERRTKTAVAQGLTDLTERQERIVQFLTNYGTLINKDFAALFPSISEDSVLRDLKVLIDKD
ncbi:hypothetical protein KJ605_00765, partial [Patescibacteria group bacterium]|nr:hypothetical protein [Patescibacteria group bacterium]